MSCMDELLASLRQLVKQYPDSPDGSYPDLLWDLNVLIDSAPAPVYQYRNHPKWDTTWMDLDESQVPVVLQHGHQVERRQVTGVWEPVTEAPRVSD